MGFTANSLSAAHCRTFFEDFSYRNFVPVLRYILPQLSIKKNSAAREAAMKEQRELPNPIYVPLPVWKETKERIRMQMDATRQTFHERSRVWEQKEQVGYTIYLSTCLGVFVVPMLLELVRPI
jgi:hypothetical protein